MGFRQAGWLISSGLLLCNLPFHQRDQPEEIAVAAMCGKLLANDRDPDCMTADRTSKAMKHRQDNGQRMTSAKTIPFGQMADPDNDAMTIPCPAELDAVNIACSMKSHGHSLRDIAKELGPIRGKTLSPQSVKILISRSTEHESFRFV